jgi:SAM-dependent methyltransferase
MTADERAADAPEWLRANRANWDERVPIHLASRFYDLDAFRRGERRLGTIEEREVGPVTGLRVLHLMCHFGKDSLVLASRGAEVVGLDFSGPAIAAATDLAAELGLAHRARFVEANLYDAPQALPEPASFDRVFTTWGTIGWLPDIRGWAAVVAHFLKPGGALYIADAHPSALVFDDCVEELAGRPGWFAPYFETEALQLDEERDYADPEVRLANRRAFAWMHPLGEVVTALIAEGLVLRWLHEHDAIAWAMFRSLVRGPDGLWRWPDRPWLPLSFSLWAERSPLPCRSP